LTKLIRRLWTGLATIQTAVALLLALAVLSIAGSLIAQRLPEAAYLRAYGRSLGGLILWLGLDHVFSSPLYTAVAIGLGLAIVACFAGRARSLRRRLGNASAVGSLALHLGVVVVLLGVLLTASSAAEEQLWLRPGTTASALGVAVRLDDFEIQYYADLSPQQYISRGYAYTVGSSPEATDARQFELMVNHPLKFGGATLYQYAYRWSVSLNVLDAGGAQRALEVAQGQSVAWPGTHLYLSLTAFEQYAGQYPVATLLVHDGNQPLGAWQLAPGERRQLAGLWVEVSGWRPETGLLVRRDTGAPVVAVGGVLVLVGVMVRFLAPPPKPRSHPSPDKEVAA
jgi:cytochrome c biogenesis protein